MCREEAAELSSLKPELDRLGVPLYAVVKEDVGTEVQNFRAFFKGEIFLDEKVAYYLFEMVLWTTRAEDGSPWLLRKCFGEGFVLGGVFVIGRGQQGILLEHREIEFGDKVNIKDVIEAVRTMPLELQPMANK
uniref:Peroxiredoxin-like 2A n=1 Tax=Neogobius melanostomus TaxID=47308 RepID=A0A8C6SSU5_9GOBI